MLARLLHILFGMPLSRHGGRLHWAWGTHHPGLIFCGAIILAILGWWSYRAQTAAPGSKRTMALLRGGVLAAVALLLARPMLVRVQAHRTPSVVAIWLDSSLSMSLRDPYRNPAMQQLAAGFSSRKFATHGGRLLRPTRLALARRELVRAAKTWLKKICRRQRVALFVGAAHARLLGLADNTTELAGLLARLSQCRPDGPTTDVPAVVREIFQRLRSRPLSAVILLTDGRSTSGGSAASAIAVARRRATPIFALPVGEIHAPFNLALAQVQAPHHAFIQDPVAVRAVVRVTGATGVVRTRASLYEVARDGKVIKKLAGKPVVISPGHRQATIRLIFHPRRPGRHRLLLRLKPVAGELTERGNRAGPMITDAVQAKIRVLYVDGYPRWEYRYLKNDLMREKTTRISCLLLSADNRFAQEGNIPINHFPETQSQLNRYDVLLLGDVNPDYFSPAQQKLILRFVGRFGGGFGMIAGWRYAPMAYAHTPLAALLPVLIATPANSAPPKPSISPFELHVTAAGKRSPLFEFFDSRRKNLRQVAHLPPLYWFQSVAGLAPSGVVLADLPAYKINGRPAPLIVFGRYGAGRTMFSAICDTWRWRYYHGAPLYKSYWLQMVRLLARRRVLGSSHRLTLRASASQAQSGQEIRLFLKIRDPALAGQMPARLRLAASGPGGGESVIMVPTDSSHQLYEGSLTLERLGQYHISAPPGELAAPLKPLRVRVVPPNLEFNNPRVDMAALCRLARATGGSVLPLPQAARLAGLIPDRSVQTISRQSRQIWNKPIALALLVILLTVEWVLRKRAGLI